MDVIERWFERSDEDLVLSLMIVVVAMLAWWLFNRLGQRAIMAMSRQASDKHALEREQRAQTLWVAIRRVGLVLWFVAVGLTLLAVWGVPVTGLLAVGSVFGVAVGFGAQGLVADVIAGFFLIIEDQYGLGDTIRVGGVSGTVEDIQLRVTVLRDIDGTVHYIPNGQITVATNLTQGHAQAMIDVGVAYDTDLDAAMAAMEDEMRALATEEEFVGAFLADPEIFGVNELADSAVILRGRVKVLPDDRWRVKRELLRRIKIRFEAEGIEIPFPQRVLHMTSDA